MEGKKITKILDIGGQYRALLLDDKEVAIVKVVVDDLSIEELVEFLPSSKDAPENTKKESKKETKKETKKEIKKESKKEPEPEEYEGNYTWEDLEEMDFEGLEDLCDELELEIESADFEEDEVDDFRKAIAEELELEIPEDEEEEESEEEEEGGDDYTWEDLEEMDFEELQDFCDENEMELDPEDFTEEDEDKFRRAIAKEAGIEAPKPKPKPKRKK